jgi:hypothetical protein
MPLPAPTSLHLPPLLAAPVPSSPAEAAAQGRPAAEGAGRTVEQGQGAAGLEAHRHREGRRPADVGFSMLNGAVAY